jgi:hypothetical protein
MAFLCFIRNKTGTGKPDSLIFYALSPANEIGSQGVLNSLSGILSNSSSVHPVNRLADAVRNKLSYLY